MDLPTKTPFHKRSGVFIILLNQNRITKNILKENND
jgi:hypothetical protein